MTDKHTEDPWKAHVYTDSGNVYVKGGRSGLSIAKMLDAYPDQKRANGVLMAAALALLEACEAMMRPDGHYIECPCTGCDSIWGQGHEHMPNNRTVAICKQLQLAIKQAKGD